MRRRRGGRYGRRGGEEEDAHKACGKKGKEEFVRGGEQKLFFVFVLVFVVLVSRSFQLRRSSYGRDPYLEDP